MGWRQLSGWKPSDREAIFFLRQAEILCRQTETFIRPWVKNSFLSKLKPIRNEVCLHEQDETSVWPKGKVTFLCMQGVREVNFYRQTETLFRPKGKGTCLSNVREVDFHKQAETSIRLCCHCTFLSNLYVKNTKLSTADNVEIASEMMLSCWLYRAYAIGKIRTLKFKADTFIIYLFEKHDDGVFVIGFL